MALWELFRTFFVIGLFSFGGGYAMIPVISHQTHAHTWMTNQEFTDIIAVAGMSPGPIGTNSAIFVGYRVDGFPGAVAAAVGITLPSLLVVLLLAACFMRLHSSLYVQRAFYGLRPVVAGLILYGAVRFAAAGGMDGRALNASVMGSVIIFALSLTALLKFRVHPLRLVAIAGLAGMAAYG